MNGVHDLGGMTVLGPVQRKQREPIFHEPWEKRMFAMVIATSVQGLYSIDEFRHAIERMNPVSYLASSYYERWLAAIHILMIEKGHLSRQQIAERLTEFSSRNDTNQAVTRRTDPRLTKRLLEIVRRGSSTRREKHAIKPRFSSGDRVVARNMHPPGHTRIPLYVRGKRGVIERLHGIFVFPDENAHGRGETPQPVYSVRFSARELWGDAASVKDSLYVDLWETYLMPEKEGREE